MEIKKDNPLISIIIPVYNVEKYIDQCIASIVNQTYSILELILINDGSTDGTFDKLKAWELRDNRIKLINQTNAGVSKARNIGIDHSTGDYIMFVDSDDWLNDNAIKFCVDALNENMNIDLILFGWEKTFGDKKVKEGYFFKEGRQLFNTKIENIRRRSIGMLPFEMLNPVKTDVFNTPWAKLISSKKIKNNNIRFYDRFFVGMEDVLFTVQLYQYINIPVQINQYLYNYRQENQISLSKADGADLMKKFKNLFNILDKQFKGCTDEIQIALNNRKALSIINLLLNIISKRRVETLGNRLNDIRFLLKSEPFRECLFKLDISFMPLKWKAFFFLAKRNNSFLIFLMLIIIQRFR
jgi:glycosyltransferase involved in cell wall biosynthesis